VYPRQRSALRFLIGTANRVSLSKGNESTASLPASQLPINGMLSQPKTAFDLHEWSFWYRQVGACNQNASKRLHLGENSDSGKGDSARRPSPQRATVLCVRKVKTVRQKQKFIRILTIWNGFEVLICAAIESDDDVEPFSGSLDVERRHLVFDLRNSLVSCQCPMSSIRVAPTNRVNAKFSGLVLRDDVVYAEVPSHWSTPHKHDDGDEGLLGALTEANPRTLD
jgi:hypothetical protein